MNASRDEYDKRLMSRNQEASSESALPAKDDFKSAAQSMGGSMATQSAQQGDILGTAGGGMMMSGNPYLMAAGLGLQVYSSGEKNKRAAEERQRQEYNERIMRRQEMMNQMAQMRIE